MIGAKCRTHHGIFFYLMAGLSFLMYCFDKRAYTFYVTNKSVHIVKSWVFGAYERELTLDQIRDVHISQGFFPKVIQRVPEHASRIVDYPFIVESES
jgi:hypothetical protein